MFSRGNSLIRTSARTAFCRAQRRALAAPASSTSSSDDSVTLSKADYDRLVGGAVSEQIEKLQRSLSRSELSRSGSLGAVSPEEAAASSSIITRTLTTTEVIVSKIFPAGFGWQGASVVAENMGFAGDSASFALTTGVGDATGVFIGHSAYFAIKKMIFDNTIDMRAQVHTATLLAGAAFCAGTSWQPCVNALQGVTTLGFNPSAAITGAVCGTMFMGGLRLGRHLWPAMGLDAVEKPTYSNLKADFGLSVAIGGATGAFVGTDVSYGDANWLRPVVGVEEGMADLTGMALAGTSTGLGFAAVQTAQNVAVPSNKNWVD